MISQGQMLSWLIGVMCFLLLVLLSLSCSLFGPSIWLGKQPQVEPTETVTEQFDQSSTENSQEIKNKTKKSRRRKTRKRRKRKQVPYTMKNLMY